MGFDYSPTAGDARGQHGIYSGCGLVYYGFIEGCAKPGRHGLARFTECEVERKILSGQALRSFPLAGQRFKEKLPDLLPGDVQDSGHAGDLVTRPRLVALHAGRHGAFCHACGLCNIALPQLHFREPYAEFVIRLVHCYTSSFKSSTATPKAAATWPAVVRHTGCPLRILITALRPTPAFCASSSPVRF